MTRPSLFEPETSQALGFGFRCGFLGLLHMEIIQERLEREFRVGLIATAPSVIYRVETTDGKTAEIDNPSLLPDQAKIRALYEPYVDLDIHVPSQYLGNVMKLARKDAPRRKNLRYLSNNRVVATYEIPLRKLFMIFLTASNQSAAATLPWITSPAATSRPTWCGLTLC